MQAGQRVDRYIVEEELGRGGMAVVYRVRHTTLDSIHALKLLHTDRPAVADRLVQEGKLQASLRHPHVVAVTDVIVVDGAPGLVMEYLPDGALDEVVPTELSEPEVRELFRGICSGVAHAHSLGMVHRDLKPGNVLVQRVDGKLHPKVADFGLAKVLAGGEGGPGLTRTGVAMGTPAYMAPEQVRDAKNVDARADVWALGVILFELLAGRRLFRGNSSLDVMNAVVAGPQQQELQGLPAWAAPVVTGALRPKDSRVADAGALLRVLDGEEAPPEPVEVGNETLDWDASLPGNETFDGGPVDAEPTPAPDPASEAPAPAPLPPPHPEPTPEPRPTNLRPIALLLPVVLAFTSALAPVDAMLHYPVVRAARGSVQATDVVVIGIEDDSDLRSLRPQHAELIGRLEAAGAKAVVFDMVFRAADDADPVLAAAVRDAGIPVIATRVFRAGQPVPYESEVLDTALSFGIVEVWTDTLFGTTRMARVQRRQAGGDSVWSVSVEAARAVVGGAEPEVRGGELVIGALRNPVWADLATLAPCDNPPRLPYGTDDLSPVAGKVAFVGLTSGPRDLLRTPEGTRYGVSVLAGFTQTLLRQATLSPAPPEVNTLAALLAGLGTLLLGMRLERRMQPVALVIPAGILAVALALAASGVLVALTPTILAGAMGFWAVRGSS